MKAQAVTVFRCSTCLSEQKTKNLIVVDFYTHQLCICEKCQIKIFGKIGVWTVEKAKRKFEREYQRKLKKQNGVKNGI